MTSLEALESWFSVISTQDKIRWEEHYKVIKKHLEVLEILKKHYDVSSLIVSLDNFISFHIYKTDKDFNKVKEWLDEKEKEERVEND